MDEYTQLLAESEAESVALEAREGGYARCTSMPKLIVGQAHDGAYKLLDIVGEKHDRIFSGNEEVKVGDAVSPAMFANLVRRYCVTVVVV